MRPTIPREEVVQLLASAREATLTDEEKETLLADWQVNSVCEALSQAYAGVTNGFLTQLYEAITGRKGEVIGEPAKLLPCPCCGYRTLSELYDLQAGTGYDICDFCGWEDAGTTDPTQRSGPNRGSMAEYRARLESDANYYQRNKWPR